MQIVTIHASESKLGSVFARSHHHAPLAFRASLEYKLPRGQMARTNLSRTMCVTDTLDLFHQHSLWTSAKPHPCPRSPSKPYFLPSAAKAHPTARTDGVPVHSEIESRDSAGGIVSTITSTTASTSITTNVHYDPLSGQVYALVNDQGGTALSLSAADNRSIVGSVHRGLDEQVCYASHQPSFL
jgi:hypothetical protein